MFKSMPTNYISLYRHFPPLYKRDQTYFLDKSHLDFFLIWTRKKKQKNIETIQKHTQTAAYDVLMAGADSISMQSVTVMTSTLH